MEIETIINQKSEIIDKKLKELINTWMGNKFYDTANYIIEAGGKRYRPILTLLACEAVGGNQLEALNSASAIELIHTGSLLWDDIIDQDELRRGKIAVHKKWDVNTAILAGAYFTSKALELCTDHPQILEPMLKTVSKLVEGEIIDISTSIYNIENETRGQPIFESRVEADIFDTLKDRVKNNIFKGLKWEKRSDYKTIAKISESTEEANYFGIIANKSASLIKLAAKVGAIIGGGSKEDINALGEYGLYLGLAFQIKDDLLGLTSKPEVLGKPIGKDLQKGKLTLYLIHALRNLEEEEIEEFLELHKDAQNPKNLTKIIEIFKKLGSITYAQQKAKLLIKKIVDILDDLENPEYKEILKSFANFTIERIK
ncbi:MAG: polyprenyl synthetase family protein [Candidatus Helarchaeota archaeon]|nr:polyprenyl synthetase family protein [Candidatus Helarchaeota archaeon]